MCGQAGRHNIRVESDLRSKFQDGNVVGDSEVGIYDRRKCQWEKKQDTALSTKKKIAFCTFSFCFSFLKAKKSFTYSLFDFFLVSYIVNNVNVQNFEINRLK